MEVILAILPCISLVVAGVIILCLFLYAFSDSGEAEGKEDKKTEIS